MDKYVSKRPLPATEVIESVPRKKPKNNQKFKHEYSRDMPCLIPSRVNPEYAYCTVCKLDFSIAHGGRDDCRRHISCKRHCEFSKAKESSHRVDTFFTKIDDSSAIKSECYFARFLIEHNLPLSVADHAAPLFAQMFPDSDIAKKYSSGRTKTSAIVRSMARSTQEILISVLKKNPFALATDGSNDIESKKLYPLVVSYYDCEEGLIKTALLSLLECSTNTGEGIFQVIDAEFERLQIPWSNCVAFSVDNTNTMIGKNKGVVSFVKMKQPNIKIIGCPCHLVHLVAQKATKALPIDIELFLVQIFYYLEKSSKRKNTLKELQELCEEKSHKILKHVNTRWLSLEKSLSRVLEQWIPLTMFFSEESNANGNNKMFSEITGKMKAPETKLYCLFLKAAIPTLTKINKVLQKESPVIHYLHEHLRNLYFELLARFITPKAISKCDSVFTVDFKKKANQKSDVNLVIGCSTKSYLDEGNLSSAEVQKFYSSVREFYCAACTYVQKKIPLQDEFFSHALVADVKRRTASEFASVKYFADLFPIEVDLDLLEMEFAMYQSEAFCADILEEARVDAMWHKISNLKNGDGSDKYPLLSKVMLCVLVVPHSNATTERVFSMVKKNQNEFRSSLNTKTLESLLVEKLTMKTCYNKKFSDVELARAKSACYKELSSQSKKNC